MTTKQAYRVAYRYARIYHNIPSSGMYRHSLYKHTCLDAGISYGVMHNAYRSIEQRFDLGSLGNMYQIRTLNRYVFGVNSAL